MPFFKKSQNTEEDTYSEAVDQLNKAMKGMGTDENEIIDVAGRYTSEERE